MIFIAYCNMVNKVYEKRVKSAGISGTHIFTIAPNASMKSVLMQAQIPICRPLCSEETAKILGQVRAEGRWTNFRVTINPLHNLVQAPVATLTTIGPMFKYKLSS